MSYYDNVKDNVRNKGKDDSEESANFDTLREAAEESSEQEQEGDDTPIEVLEEGGLRKEEPKKQKQQKTGERNRQDKGTRKTVNKEEKRSAETLKGSSEANDELANKLDRIIEQNERMIEILESFAS